MEIAAYVQAFDGRPLMPVQHRGRVRRMLKSGKARIVMHLPFTIRLTKELEEEHTQQVILGQDPGRTNIGLCAINDKCQVLYASDIETRNKLIAGLMLKRKQARQASRRGERLVRKRRAKKNKTLMMENTAMGVRPVNGRMVWKRWLPQCDKPVPVKDIRNTEARFCNRKRPKGWLTPTAHQLLQTHISALNRVMKILPVTDIAIELNRFSFARMENPDISGKEFQCGPLKGFDSPEEAVSQQQNGHCLFCKKKIAQFHHIVPRSRGGSNTVQNLAGLCECHHDKVHKDADWREKLLKKKQGLEKKYHALSTLNQIIPYLWAYLERMEPWVNIHPTTGWITKQIRDSVGLDKDHHVDAWCIAASVIGETEDAPDFGKVFHLMQFRRHNRAMTARVESRKYYRGSQMVAVNRNKAVTAVPKQKNGEPVYDENGQMVMEIKGQTENSLAEFREQMTAAYGKKEADRIVSLLRVVPSRRCMNDMSRLMPGATLMAKDGTVFVMENQHNNCTRYKQGISGVKTRKSEIAALKRQLKKLEKDGGDTRELEKQISEQKAALPQAQEYQKTSCRVLLHNSGLVYIPDAV